MAGTFDNNADVPTFGGSRRRDVGHAVVAIATTAYGSASGCRELCALERWLTDTVAK